MIRRAAALFSVFLSGCASFHIVHDGEGFTYLPVEVYPEQTSFTPIGDHFGRQGIRVGLGGMVSEKDSIYTVGNFEAVENRWSFFSGYLSGEIYRNLPNSPVGFGLIGYVSYSHYAYNYYRYERLNDSTADSNRVKVNLSTPSLTLGTYMDFNWESIRFVPLRVYLSVSPYVISEMFYRDTVYKCRASGCVFMRVDFVLLGVNLRFLENLSVGFDAESVFLLFFYSERSEITYTHFPIPSLTLSLNVGELDAHLKAIYMPEFEQRWDRNYHRFLFNASVSYRIRPWNRKEVKVEWIE